MSYVWTDERKTKVVKNRIINRINNLNIDMKNLKNIEELAHLLSNDKVFQRRISLKQIKSYFNDITDIITYKKGMDNG